MKTEDRQKATYHFFRAAYYYAVSNPIWHIEHAKMMKAAGIKIDSVRIKLPKNARPSSWRRNANRKFQDEQPVIDGPSVINMSPAVAKFSLVMAIMLCSA